MSAIDRRRFLEGALAVAASGLVAPACSGSEAGTTVTSTTSSTPAPTSAGAGGDVPDQATIHGWIER
ncbi:MAG: hypothetical protein KF703_08180, partial [Actinobacteria bacterium]|nr:hypothetical protein [Actinomycetota bacterium]